MKRRLAALVAVLALALPGCGKAPPIAGSGAIKLKENVWATYAWSKSRMVYIIYFVPNPGTAFNPEGAAATVKLSKEGDVFEGALDGYLEKSKSPFKAEPKKGEVTIEGRTYRGNSVFLVTVGSPSKVQVMPGVAWSPAPKDPEELPLYAEAEVKRLAKENPKIGEFPKDPASEKPDPKTKKK